MYSLYLTGFHKGVVECEDEACAAVAHEEQLKLDTTEDQHHNHLAKEAVGQSCVGQVEALSENLDLTVRHTEATRQTKDCVCCEQSRAEVNRLLEENRKLQSQLKKTELNEHFFKG